MPKQKPSKYFSFVSGFVQSKDIIRCLAQSDELNEKEEANTTLMKWVRSERKRYDFHMDWYATRMWVSQTNDPDIVLLGPDGRVLVSAPDMDQTERVAAPEESTNVYGELRDLAQIGDSLYTAGMRRQVYRRLGTNRWTRVDQGMLEQPNAESVAGLNAIDGDSEDNILAVGFGGEIWRRNKAGWQKEQSPTNVMLNSVRVLGKSKAFACGAEGVILKYHSGHWEPVEHGTTDEEFWDAEWFRDHLFLSTSDGLFYLREDDSLEPIKLSNRAVTCGTLHARDGVLLSVGSKHIFTTVDGLHWSDLQAE